MNTNKNKPKFGTANADSNSTLDYSKEFPVPTNSFLSIFSIDAIDGLFQSMGNLVNNDVYNNLIGQIGQSITSIFTTISEHPFLQNGTNRGWVLIGGSVIGTFFLISMLWQFIFGFMYVYILGKMMLWFLEHYEPDNSSDVSSDISLSDSYVSESSPVDVMEYQVVFVFVMFLSSLSYLPLPNMNIFVNGLCILLSITSIASKEYRRKICRFTKDLLVDPNLVPGQEGRIHKALQTFCYTFEIMNIGIFNMVSNSRTVYSDLKSSESLIDGLHRLTRRPLKMLNRTNQYTKTATKKKNDDFEDDLDESFD